METLETPTREGSTIVNPITYDLSMPEFRDVLALKYKLSYDQHRWLSMPEVIDEFLKKREIPNTMPDLENRPFFESYAEKCLAEEYHRDYAAQQKELKKAIDEMTEEKGRELTHDEKLEAYMLWQKWKAEDWKKTRHSLKGIFGDKYDKINLDEVHNVEPIKQMIYGLCKHWCDIFGYQPEMQNPDFRLNFKDYQDYKRRREHDGEEIQLIRDRPLEIIVIGEKSKEARESLRKGCMDLILLNNSPSEVNDN